MVAIGRGGERGLELADVTFGPGAAMGLGGGVHGLTPFLDA